MIGYAPFLGQVPLAHRLGQVEIPPADVQRFHFLYQEAYLNEAREIVDFASLYPAEAKAVGLDRHAAVLRPLVEDPERSIVLNRLRESRATEGEIQSMLGLEKPLFAARDAFKAAQLLIKEQVPSPPPGQESIFGPLLVLGGITFAVLELSGITSMTGMARHTK